MPQNGGGSGIMEGVVNAGVNAATGNLVGVVTGLVNTVMNGGQAPASDGWMQIGYPGNPIAEGYYKWCQKYQPDKLQTGDVWDEPNSKYKFENAWRDAQIRVRAATAGQNLTGDQEWAIIAQGTFDQNMVWTPPGVSGGGGASGGGHKRDGGGGTLTGGPFIWPWEPNAWQAAGTFNKVLWFLVPASLMALLYFMFGNTSRRSGEKR